MTTTEPDPYDDYRAVTESLVGCDEPDLALRIAYQGFPDRKAVLADGASNAMFFRHWMVSALAFVTPWPTTLEAIDVWGGGTRTKADLSKGRASSTGWFVSLILTSLGAWLLDVPLDVERNVLLYHVVWFAQGLVIAVAAWFLFAYGMRRTIARLDEESVLETVAARLKEIVHKDPSTAPYAMMLTRSRFRAPGTMRWFEFGMKQKLGKGRTWTARYESHDPARNVCVYRVRLFDKKRHAGDLFAEVALAPDGKPPAAKELSDRIAKVAAAGHSNVPTLGEQS